MKSIKKVLALSLSVMLLISACGKPADSPQPSQQEGFEIIYTPGTYSGTTSSFSGPLTVDVTVDESSIKDIKLTEFNDSVMVGDTAFETISRDIMEHQSLKVDMVAGASISSSAVIRAITDALSKTGANIDALKAKEIVKAAPGKLDLETDVVVVGSGLAGVSAAITAAENGAKVMLLERLGRLGGTSALSAGWVHAAGTDIQEKNNVKDSAEKFYEDWMMLAERAKDEYVEPDMVKYITDHSAENIQWLIDHGVKMMDSIFAAGIYEGRNIPRIHQTEGGKGYIIKYLMEDVNDLGIEVRVNTRATELIKEGDKVTGVKAVDKDGNEVTVKAKSVILASGGFAGNPEMMAKYYPQYTDYINSSVNTGDTLAMGEGVGADIIVKNAAQIHHNLAADTSLGYFTPECIYVTPEGERYVDEAEYFYTRTRVLNEKGFGDTHMIIPQMLYDAHKEGIDKALETGKAFKTDTIEELAQKMGMKPEVLKNTIDRYNEMVKAKKDTDFNKPSEYLYPIEAPYIGLDLTGNLNDTYVSLRINMNAQVIDKSGNVINGLYAVGAAASAQTLNQEYIGSGSALLNGLTFGNVAGVHAAKNE
ncbi:fumarate reductase flavoprotein subunit precursor [Oxobacter pfennigii]|uniref:Urocanate reductase n=1 Tax=Oxobacter pfennigii TaxID=36849 RepID=A0A0P8YBH0_9CLOT|nr:FAD-dependent oxidoreductase [Oxobacter pfennigii]KPU44395.1 fumarate reductase flavoprotein subunit precursor [Oxobacter pfennigii]